MEQNIFNDILVVAKDVENYHKLNHVNTVPIYIEGSEYYSLFKLLVNVTKINCSNYLITYNDWRGFEQEIQVKKDKFDSQVVKRPINYLITYNDWRGFEQEIQVKKDKFDSQVVKRPTN